MAVKSPSGIYVAYVEDNSEKNPEVIWGWGKNEEEALKNANAAEDAFGLQMDIEPEIYGVSQLAAKLFTGPSKVKKFKGGTFKIANGVLDLSNQTLRGTKKPQVFKLPQDLQNRVVKVAEKASSDFSKDIVLTTRIKKDKIYISGEELQPEDTPYEYGALNYEAANEAGEAVCKYIEDEYPNKPLGGLKCIMKPAKKGIIFPRTCVIKVYYWP